MSRENKMRMARLARLHLELEKVHGLHARLMRETAIRANREVAQ